MLRPATDADLPAMLRWRNHPKVREASFTRHEITADEHRRWWCNLGDRVVLVFELDGEPAGIVQFGGHDRADASVSWAFFLDIETLAPRGALLPAWMQLEGEAVAYAFDELGVRILRGETLADNMPVRALHRRFGFTESAVFEREVDGVPHRAVRTEMHVIEWRKKSAESRRPAAAIVSE